jgi:hypothetical protein
MKQNIKLGVTDYTALVFIPDPASTDGSGKTGLVAANLTVSYARVETDNDVTITDATSSLNNLAALTSAHNDWGLLEVSSTLAPGLYRLDIADAVFASGAWTAVVYVMITTSAAAASPMEFVLVAYDQLDTVRLGLTALPNAAADAAGGLIISDAGGLDADAQLVTKINDILTDTGTTLQAEVDGIQADTEDIQTRLPAALVGGRIDASVGAMAANVLTATAINANAITAAKLDPDVTTELQAGLATQTSVDDLPTNAELATALGTADDAVLAQVALVKTETDKIAAIKAKTDQLTFTVANQVDANALTGGGGLTAAQTRAAIGLASANLDDQLNALPTAAENAAEVISAAAADPIAANVKEVNDVALQGNGSTQPWGPV